MKEECRKTHRDKLFHGLKCKDEFGKIMEYVDSLHYEDRVDYAYVYEMLRTVRLLRSFEICIFLCNQHLHTLDFKLLLNSGDVIY
uniref:Protein kinase domain-containing protein n=1 Tax=Ascaris lumbricoides TaxID=6252 RepID=A0A0M3IJP9_ASCLU